MQFSQVSRVSQSVSWSLGHLGLVWGICVWELSHVTVGSFCPPWLWARDISSPSHGHHHRTAHNPAPGYPQNRWGQERANGPRRKPQSLLTYFQKWYPITFFILCPLEYVTRSRLDSRGGHWTRAQVPRSENHWGPPWRLPAVPGGTFSIAITIYLHPYFNRNWKKTYQAF